MPTAEAVSNNYLHFVYNEIMEKVKAVLNRNHLLTLEGDIWDDCFTGRKVFNCALSTPNETPILLFSERIPISQSVTGEYLSNLIISNIKKLIRLR